MAALMIAAAPCAAADDGGDSDRLDITGRIPPECRFTETPTSTNLGTVASGAEFNVGNLGFTCNLAALSSVNLTVRSSNGALKRDGGSETIAYSAWWKVSSFTDFTPVAGWNPSAFPFTEPSAANGVRKSASLVVKITGPTGNLTAGNYTDTLTFTVSP